MRDERFLVTGALGCIGAWVVKRLLVEETPVWTYDLGGDPHRLRLILSDGDLDRVNFVEGDILDAARFERLVAGQGITHIVHLAALQVPLVRANPALGAQVNVAGMAHVLEAARKHAGQVQGLTYASSAAVYGPAHLYPPGPVDEAAPLRPDTLYGVHKQANEGMARVYFQDFGVSSVGLRPYVVYGPGRDQGVTSGPTKAILAAVAGREYQIGFAGRATLQHAQDAAHAFIRAARSRRQGASVYNLGGSVVSMADVVQAIEECVPAAKGRITCADAALPFPSAIDGSRFDNEVGEGMWMPLREGVRKSVETFRVALAQGRVDLSRALGNGKP